jgi:hypothetical protein
MQIDAQQFKRLAAIVFGVREDGYRDGDAAITGAQAEAIVAVAEMTVSVDDHDDDDEAEVYEIVAQEVRALAGGTSGDAVPPDDADLDVLAATLTGKSGELAYVVAYVLTIADLAIEPVEEEFLEDLREALAISDDRVDALVDGINTALTPAE